MSLKALILSGVLGAVVACSTYRLPEMKKHEFPKTEAYIGDPKRPFESLGQVRAKATFVSLDPEHDEKVLCRNYYNKAVRDLVKLAKDQGGDAVVDIKSVVFLYDGKVEYYTTPECADDGAEGEILVQGIAVKWKPESKS